MFGRIPSAKTVERALRAGLLLAAIAIPARASGQDVAVPLFASAPAPALPGGAPSQPEPLPGLRQPADIPPSLMMPGGPSFTCDLLPGPYVDGDPRLDPPVLPQPGWVFDAEVDVLFPRIGGSPPSPADGLSIANAKLDWTAAPRIEIGHRLPEGLGELSIAYRFLGSEGTNGGHGPDGPTTLNSRLFLNMLDLDYASNELSICCWWMKWRVGLRAVDAYFDSREDESAAEATGHSGIVERKFTNNNWGLGPHASLELERRLGDSGVFFLTRLDLSNVLGRINQSWLEVTTTPGVSNEIRQSQASDMTILTAAAGIGYRPPQCQPLRVFLGYQYEHWWNVGKFGGSSPGNNAEIEDQGILLRADFNY